jgi:PAS domain-containing protein
LLEILVQTPLGALVWRGKRGGGMPALDAWWPDQPASDPAVMRAVQDFDGYTLAINSVHQAVLEWTRDELCAVPFWEVVHPQDRDSMMEDRERLVLQGPGRLDGQRIRTLGKDGWYRLIRWDFQARNAEERIYLTGLDLSDATTPCVFGKRQLVGSWDWDIAHDSMSWSDGAFEICGLAPLPAHNLEFALRRLHEDDRALVAEQVRRVLTTGEAYTVTHRIVRADGAIRRLYSAGRSFTGEDGWRERMRGLIWDIIE